MAARPKWTLALAGMTLAGVLIAVSDAVYSSPQPVPPALERHGGR